MAFVSVERSGEDTEDDLVDRKCVECRSRVVLNWTCWHMKCIRADEDGSSVDLSLEDTEDAMSVRVGCPHLNLEGEILRLC